jgi:DNA/RNA endonuclease G (NUC1)
MGFQVDTNTYIAANINRAILGYDRGHLAGIQDFADSCALTNSTFKYYDAVPLTPNLNRIIWKLDESLNRQESQSDSLWIIAGISYQDCILTYYYSDIRILLPRHYWRVVQSLSNNAILHCTIYDNTKQTRKTETDITNIQRLLGCQIPLQGTPTMPVKTKKIPVPQAMQVDSTKTAPTKRPVHHPVNTSPVEIKGNGAATAPPPTPMIKPPDVSSTPPIN